MTAPSYKQGFAWWAFADRTPATARDLLATASQVGVTGIDFLPRPLWAQARSAGFDVTIIDGHEAIEIGFNNPTYHATLTAEVRRNIAIASAEGIPFLSVSVGDRVTGRSDGMAQCVTALAPLAEEACSAGVTLLVEPLNSKVDHPSHECDTTAWAVELIHRVGSTGLRLLFDCYHAQVMEGDLIRTLQQHLPLVAHIHTAGCPGRHELDDDQEINWTAIARWLNTHDYRGWVTHEFIPTTNIFSALQQAHSYFARP